jgi:hypothetical protein
MIPKPILNNRAVLSPRFITRSEAGIIDNQNITQPVIPVIQWSSLGRSLITTSIAAMLSRWADMLLCLMISLGRHAREQPASLRLQRVKAGFDV